MSVESGTFSGIHLDLDVHTRLVQAICRVLILDSKQLRRCFVIQSAHSQETQYV